MQKRLRGRIFAAARRAKRDATREQAELALLAEFMRHGSVAALAGAIAKRLGGRARGADLIDRADLDERHEGRWRLDALK
jgi:hypothetical protein